jgi:Protein of unknown function (DUF3800)
VRKPYKEEYSDSGIPKPVELEDWMAVFHVYGDESGKLSGKSDYTSFCGYVGHVSAWAQFAQLWNDCRFKWQVPPIHMSRIAFPDSKDDGWKKVKADWGDGWEKMHKHMLRELGEIVRGCDIVCVGAVVDCKHFRMLAEKYPLFKKAHRDPIHMAFHMFIIRGIDATEVIDKQSNIGIIIDEDKDFAIACYKQLETLKSLAAQGPNFARVKDRVHALSFVNDNSYPGVQAADMIAYESRRLMVENITNPNATSELYDDLTFKRLHQPKFFTPKILDEMQATNPVTEETPDE